MEKSNVDAMGPLCAEAESATELNAKRRMPRRVQRQGAMADSPRVAASRPARKPAARRALRTEAATLQDLDIKPSSVCFSPFSGRAEPTAQDLGYVSGLFDGEGCIHIARQTYGAQGRRATYRLRLDIAQNDLRVLQEVEWALQVGGRYSTMISTGRSRTPCHALIYDGLEAFAVLKRIGALLRRKRSEAELAEEFRRTCHVHRHFGPKGCPAHIWQLRAWYYSKMRSLKKAGGY